MQLIAQRAFDAFRNSESQCDPNWDLAKKAFMAGWEASRICDKKVVGVATIRREVGMTVNFSQSFQPHDGEELDFVRRIEPSTSDVCPSCGCVMEGWGPHNHKVGCKESVL